MRFIGRSTYLEALDHFLLLDSPGWLLNLHGLAGIGKTTLLKQYAAQLAAAGPSPAYIDLEINNDYPHILDALGRSLLARNLSEAACSAYHQAMEQHRAWELSQRPIINQSFQISQSVVGDITQSVNVLRADIRLEAARLSAETWRQLAASLGRQASPIVVFVDHWDYLVEKLDAEGQVKYPPGQVGPRPRWQALLEWLTTDLVLPALSETEFPHLKVVLISLEPVREPALREDAEMLELQPLTETEVRGWLAAEGITDAQKVQVILDNTYGNPLLISFALSAIANNPQLDLSGLVEAVDKSAASEWLMEGLIEGLPEPSGSVLRRAVVLRHWRLGDLRRLIAERKQELSDEWWRRFVDYPFVQDMDGDPGLKQFIRALREVRTWWLWRNDSGEFCDLHAQAMALYDPSVGIGRRRTT